MQVLGNTINASNWDSDRRQPEFRQPCRLPVMPPCARVNEWGQVLVDMTPYRR